jgi:DNA-binding CsgD family transcriptional regulator
VLKVRIDGDPAENGDQAVKSATREAIPADIETLLRSLVGKLAAFSGEHGDVRSDFIGEEQVLLDVEVGGVRLLALRQRRPSPISLLSPREQEIARMVASGYPNKTIASVLEISSWTVASHLRRIFMKLQVSSRAAMVTRLAGSALGELPSSGADPHEQAFPAEGPPGESGIWVGRAGGSLLIHRPAQDGGRDTDGGSQW